MEIKNLTLITKLKEHNISFVRVYFDGSGDDGDIHSIDYYNSEDELIDDPELKGKDREMFFDVCYKLIEKVGDWYNNDGGYGTLTINVDKVTHSIEYYQRTTYETDFPEEPIFK